MNILVISVGKKHSPILVNAINDYSERLGHYVSLEWAFVSPSGKNESEACKIESERIKERLNTNDEVWLLDERGKMLSSITLAKKLDDQQNNSQKRLVIIIGGAYGIDDSLLQYVNFIWSLSDLVFPHQLVRLILVEQIYRGFSILNGSKYHHQ